MHGPGMHTTGKRGEVSSLTYIIIEILLLTNGTLQYCCPLFVFFWLVFFEKLLLVCRLIEGVCIVLIVHQTLYYYWVIYDRLRGTRNRL